MMLFEYVYFLVLTGVVVLALATLYLNLKLPKRSVFDQVMVVFLIFLVFHSFFICVARYFFGSIPFVDVGAPFSLFYAPFFYTSLIALEKARNWKLRQVAIHVVPGVLFTILYLVLLVDMDFFSKYISLYLVVLYLFAGIQFIAYALFGFIRYNAFFEAKELKRVTNYSIKIMVLVALIFLSLVFDRGLSDDRSYVNGAGIYLFMLLIAIVVFRYHVSIVLKVNLSDEVGVVVSEQGGVIPVIEESVLKGGKYEKSKITEQEGLVYLERLNKVMDVDRLYLDSELTIDSLSKNLKMTKHHLTQVFTIVLNTNFNQHINQYRVLHASGLLKDKSIQASIGDIGTECGFNSRTSFFRAFKMHFGVSPADYRKQEGSMDPSKF